MGTPNTPTRLYELSVSESVRGGATRPARLTSNPLPTGRFSPPPPWTARQSLTSHSVMGDGVCCAVCGVCPCPAKATLRFLLRLVSAECVRREAMPHNNVSIARHEAASRLCRWSISISLHGEQGRLRSLSQRRLLGYPAFRRRDAV